MAKIYWEGVAWVESATTSKFFLPCPIPTSKKNQYWRHIGPTSLKNTAGENMHWPFEAIALHACYLLLSLALITITVCSINKDSCEVFVPCTGARWSILCVFLQNPHGLCYSIYQMGTWRIIWLWVYSKSLLWAAGFNMHAVSVSKKNERSVDQLIKYMIDVAMGMHYIMERGLVHRVSYA